MRAVEMKTRSGFISTALLGYYNVQRMSVMVGPTAYEKMMERYQVKCNPDLFDGVMKDIVNAAYKVHTRLGTGLQQDVFQACLRYELERMGLRVRSQLALPILYDDLEFKEAYRIDLLVEDSVIVELK